MASTTEGDDPQLNTIEHLAWKCPGLFGKDSRQLVERKTFRHMLQGKGRLIIPLFQRRYCWDEKMALQWFDDVVRGSRDIHGTHGTGKLIVKRAPDNIKDLIIIDGQQRLTTTFILLTAIRDVVVKLLSKGDETASSTNTKLLNEAITEVNSLLFRGDFPNGTDDIEIGQDLTTSKLLPSFYDRKPFFQLLLGIGGNDDDSPQSLAKSVFIEKVIQEFGKKKYDFFSRLIHQTLDLMSVMMVEIVNDINMAQVFLWFQEKSLFGPGALLYNPKPGMQFTAIDMARNLLLSPVMSENIGCQEEFYRNHWLQPIESCFTSVQDFNSALSEFIKLKSLGLKRVSEAEKAYTMYSNSAFTSMGADGKGNILTYAKLCSVLEKMIIESRQRKAGAAAKIDASVKLMHEFAAFALNFTPF